MKNINKYNGYDYRIAETMVEVFFKNHGYLVQQYGIENMLNGLELIDTNGIKNTDAKAVISQIMTMPDLVIMKLNEHIIKEVYLIDVKYRTFKTYDDFKESIQNGDLQKQAEKYKALWKGQVHIFLIAKINDEIYTFYDSVNHITDTMFIKPLSLKEHGKWINKTVLKEYNYKVNSVF